MLTYIFCDGLGYLVSCCLLIVSTVMLFDGISVWLLDIWVGELAGSITYVKIVAIKTVRNNIIQTRFL